MMVIFLIIIFLIFLVWIGGFIYSNDFSVKTKNILSSNIKRVMVVFPHADDEALACAGFISNLSKNGKNVYWIVLTKGEKGTPNGELDEKLKEVRVNEAMEAAKIYHVNNLIQKDFPDGAVEEKRDKLEKYLRDLVSKLSPDLIITYDLSGLYGHPDHMAASGIITQIVKDSSKIKLWYASCPKRILDTISLPEHMSKDANFKKRRVYPTHKIWVGLTGVLNKIKVSYVYESQGGSSSRNMPFKFIPFWFYISLTPFEYYHEVT